MLVMMDEGYSGPRKVLTTTFYWKLTPPEFQLEMFHSPGSTPSRRPRADRLHPKSIDESMFACAMRSPCLGRPLAHLD